MNELKILKITACIHGLVEINGSAAGETIGGIMSICIPEGRIFLTFTPLEKPKNGVYLPFSRILCLDCEPPSIVCDDGTVVLQIMPDNMFLLHLNPPFVPIEQPIIPHIILSWPFSTGTRSLRAIVYFDRTVNFSLEDAADRILFAYGFPEKITSPQVSAKRIGGSAFVFVEALADGDRKRLLCISAEPAINYCFYEPCAEYEILENTLHVYEEIGEPMGYLLDKQYALREGILERAGAQLVKKGGAAAPAPQNILYSFALALQYGSGELALSHLSPSLQSQVTFADLQEFFGDFVGIDKENCTDHSIAFQYAITENILFVRIFQIEIEGSKISNIAEQ